MLDWQIALEIFGSILDIIVTLRNKHGAKNLEHYNVNCPTNLICFDVFDWQIVIEMFCLYSRGIYTFQK